VHVSRHIIRGLTRREHPRDTSLHRPPIDPGRPPRDHFQARFLTSGLRRIKPGSSARDLPRRDWQRRTSTTALAESRLEPRGAHLTTPSKQADIPQVDHWTDLKRAQPCGHVHHRARQGEDRVETRVPGHSPSTSRPHNLWARFWVSHRPSPCICPVLSCLVQSTWQSVLSGSVPRPAVLSGQAAIRKEACMPAACTCEYLLLPPLFRPSAPHERRKERGARRGGPCCC
jgi:hypothetical protein